MEPHLIWLHDEPTGGRTAGVAFAADDHRIARQTGEAWTFLTPALDGLEVVEWYRHRLPEPTPAPQERGAWLDEAVARLSGQRTVEHVLGGIIASALAAA